MKYSEQREQYLQEILNSETINTNDYQMLWDEFSGVTTWPRAGFSKTNLKKVIEALDKVDFVAGSNIFAKKWDNSILLDKDFIEFIKKYEQKILIHISELKGEMKRNENQSLILYNVCGINSSEIYTLLVQQSEGHKVLKGSNRLMQDLFDFLNDISNGSALETMSCLKSVDNLLDAYPDLRVVLTKVMGLENNSSFADVALSLISKEEIKLDYMINLEIIIKNYKLHEELESTLNAVETKTSSKKPKV